MSESSFCIMAELDVGEIFAGYLEATLSIFYSNFF